MLESPRGSRSVLWRSTVRFFVMHRTLARTLPLPMPKRILSEVALLLRACATGVFCLCVSSGALAQTLPDTLVWERVGTVNDVEGLFFDGDTLYAALNADRAQVLR